MTKEEREKILTEHFPSITPPANPSPNGADAEADGIPLAENTTAMAPAPGQAQTAKELEELDDVLATPRSPFGGYSSSDEDSEDSTLHRRPKRGASRSLSNGSKAQRFIPEIDLSDNERV